MPYNPVRPWSKSRADDTLLDRHHVKKIDLLQIDVEGYDYELLKSFNFERIKPQLIRYEHRHLKLAAGGGYVCKITKL